MKVSAAAQLMSVAEFFEFESASPTKHEYYQGQVYAMSGGTMNHSRIKVNLVGELRERLRGKPCKPFDADLRIRIAKNSLITYPGASVVCGRPESDKQDPHAITNPTAVFEVVSATTEHYDRGAKFRLYKDLASLKEYVLISQDEPVIEVFRRGEGAQWIHTAFAGLGASAAVTTIGIKLPLDAIYEDVEFPPAPTPEPIVLKRPSSRKRSSRRS